MNKYYNRLIDLKIEKYLEVFGAVLIEGPKWCGKTTSAIQHAKSILRMQDTSIIKNNLLIADSAPYLLLEGEKPRLIDEWQIAPNLWDAIRVDVDNTGKKGQYILTGSSSPLTNSTMHTGTGRIARLMMRPMSLYESLDSNGIISMSQLFNEQSMPTCKSSLTINDLTYLICRGGWPQSIKENEENALLIMQEYIKSIYNNDISEFGAKKTDPQRVRLFLKSYARHIQTLTKNSTILNDLKENDISISEPTLYTYLDKLQRMFIIEETPAWSPSVRSKRAIRTANKKGFVDPSIACAILGLTPSSLLRDFELFGFMFESLCVRDLRIYAEKINGQVLHYRDNSGLECDAIIQLANGDYGLIEVKLGGRLEDEAANNLIKLETLLIQEKTKPKFKMILTGGEYGYTRTDGILVVPIACLKD